MPLFFSKVSTQPEYSHSGEEDEWISWTYGPIAKCAREPERTRLISAYWQNSEIMQLNTLTRNDVMGGCDGTADGRKPSVRDITREILFVHCAFCLQNPNTSEHSFM